MSLSDLDGPAQESIWRHAWNLTFKNRQMAWFQSGTGLVLGALFQPDVFSDPEKAAAVWATLKAGMFGAVGANILVFLIHLCRAPFRQRDKAWAHIDSVKKSLLEPLVFVSARVLHVEIVQNYPRNDKYQLALRLANLTVRTLKQGHSASLVFSIKVENELFPCSLHPYGSSEGDQESVDGASVHYGKLFACRVTAKLPVYGSMDDAKTHKKQLEEGLIFLRVEDKLRPAVAPIDIPLESEARF